MRRNIYTRKGIIINNQPNTQGWINQWWHWDYNENENENENE